MREKVINVIINLFKVKSIVTFVTVGVFVYSVVTKQLDDATVTAIIMMVFQNLFNKDNNKKGSE